MTFFEKYQNLNPDEIHNVHHAVPKEWLEYGNITWEGLHSIENLRGIPKTITETFGADLHQSTINKLWLEQKKSWRVTYGGDLKKVSKDELLQFATKVDEMIGHFFWPPE